MLAATTAAAAAASSFIIAATLLLQPHLFSATLFVTVELIPFGLLKLQFCILIGSDLHDHLLLLPLLLAAAHATANSI